VVNITKEKYSLLHFRGAAIIVHYVWSDPNEPVIVSDGRSMVLMGLKN